MSAQHKEEFSPFDIYQYLEDGKRRAFVEDQKPEAKYIDQNLIEIISKTKKQILIFSGNLSWVHLEQNSTTFLKTLEDLIERNVKVKIICNIDIGSIANVEKVLAINPEDQDKIEIKHSAQPLRAFVIDDTLARFKESKKAKSYTLLKKKTHIFYQITDKVWIRWLIKVFEKLFTPGIPARKRIRDIWTIQNLK